MEDFFKQTVIHLSQQSKCVSRQVGAIIVKDNRIISTGYNGTLSGCKNCNEIFDSNNFDKDAHHKWSKLNEIHAEQNALMMAAKYGISVKDCTCYCSLQPCNLCLLLLIQAGIIEIVYLKPYPKSNYDDSILSLIKSGKIILRKFR